MNPDNTPKDIQMEDVLVSIINEIMDLKKEFIKEQLLNTGVCSCAILAMKEWETITNKSRDEELVEVKRALLAQLKSSVEKDKEIERLKGLCHKLWDEQYPHPEYVQDEWQQFKTENQL